MSGITGYDALTAVNLDIHNTEPLIGDNSVNFLAPLPSVGANSALANSALANSALAVHRGANSALAVHPSEGAPSTVASMVQTDDGAEVHHSGHKAPRLPRWRVDLLGM
jgi:hypothetical protein